jgi:hypothetical protein
MVASGMSLRAMADALAKAGRTSRNGTPLTPTQVARIVGRLGI